MLARRALVLAAKHRREKRDCVESDECDRHPEDRNAVNYEP
jgi:hypothetical protein